jgi:hypothetical protein
MKKSLVFTKSIAFEKVLIDRLEEYMSTPEKEGKRINFSGEVANLIEAGLKYKQIEKDLLAGKRSQLIPEGAALVNKSRLKDLMKDKIEYGETALEQPKPIKGIRINKL